MINRHPFRTMAACAVMLVFISACDYFISAESRYEHAQALVEEGEHRRALIELKNALAKNPDMQQARILLAEVALWLGDPSSAEKELQKATSQQDPARYADLQVRIQLALGRYQRVLEELNAGTAVPAERQPYFRGAALLGLRQPAQAEEHLRTAIEKDPSLIEAKVALADAVAAQNDLARTLELTAEMVRAHQDSAMAWQVHGLMLMRRGDSSAGREALERSSKLAPGQLDFVRHAGLLAALTEARLAEKDVEGARSSSSELSKLAPGSPIALVSSGRVAMAGNDYVAASAELRKVVSANPNFAQARFLLGVALFAQGNLEQAGQELAAVVDLMPENIEARQLLAQVRMRQQDPDAAMRVLVPALQSGAEGSRLSALLDAARSRAGGAQTIELLERALQDSPKNRTLQIQLATAHLQSGQAERALTVLRSIEGNESGVRDEALLLQAIVKANGTAAARAEVDAMVAHDPADANVVGLAAAFYAHVGDANAARRLLSEATQRDPQNLSLIFALAQLEISSQRPAEARTALSRVLDIDPQHLPGRLLLAELELASGNTDAAKQALESARKSSPAAPLPRLLLARMALMRDDASQASALIDEALAAAPAPIEIHSAAGLLYLNNGRFDQALAHFDKVTDLDPANVTAWLNLGRAQQALGQHGAARESLMRALKLRRDWLPAEGALAFIDLQSGQRAAALERVARLQKAYPRDAAVLTLAGDVYASARDYPEAARAFEEAARIRPSATLAFKVYDVRRVGRLPKPLEPLEQWVAKNSSDVMARSLLAEAYTLAGERKRAVEHYEYVAGAQPRHVVALNNLAWLYFELGDSRARETARKAYGLAPRSAAIADTLGWILAESGQVQEGLPILKNAVALAPTIPEIRFHYAVALARSGARDQARAELDKVLEDRSEFAGRASAEQLRKQLEAAGEAGA